MIFRRMGSIVKAQRGFTLIETLVVIAITGIIGLGATTVIFQVNNLTTKNTDYTAASRQTMNAIYWISNDAQMAQTVAPSGASGFPLTLSWTGWDNTVHQVTYTLEAGRLRRYYSVDGGGAAQSHIAQYINTDESMTSCNFTSGVLTLKITASVGEGTRLINVTKTREITARPCL